LRERRSEKKRVKALLKDRDAEVRLRVALALIEAKDGDALAALVERLPEVPAGQRWRVEQLLAGPWRRAGRRPRAGTTEQEWKRYCRAWSGWWRDHGAKVDLAKLACRGACWD